MGNFKNKKVLVTGGSGFIASHLVHRLVKEGAKVIVTVKYNSVIDNIRISDIWEKITPLEADIRNPDSLQKVKALKPHLVYHFAAYNHVGDSFRNVSEAIDVNSKGTVNLMEAYDKYERFIYISSSEVYGYQKETPFTESQTPFPISPYSVGKYSGELYARMKWHVFKDPVVVLRPFNAFGPYQSPRAIIAELIMKCLRGEDIVTTGGIQTRDFNYVENLIDGFMAAAVNTRAVGEVINVGSGRDIPIKDLVRKIHSISGSRSKLYIGKLPYRPTEIWRMRADNRKAAKLLGWKPRFSLEEGLAKTVDWFRKFNDNFNDPDSGLNRLCATE